MTSKASAAAGASKAQAAKKPLLSAEDLGLPTTAEIQIGWVDTVQGEELCRRIVDLVSSGATLKANNLVEIERIADITSRLIVNRTAMKTYPREIGDLVERVRLAVA